jgi:N-acetylglucosaminyl-diphospho-decaprenol L-rhamnosyltransferase
MGSCMFVRRAAFDAVGPFDERYFLFSEEVDWMRRATDRGWTVVFTPGARCVHVGGASHGGRMFRENLRGHLRFLAKHRGIREAERARLMLLAALRLRGALFPGDRGRMYRESAVWLASGSAESLLVQKR